MYICDILYRNKSSRLCDRDDILTLPAEVDQADVPAATDMGCGGIPRSTTSHLSFSHTTTRACSAGNYHTTVTAYALENPGFTKRGVPSFQFLRDEKKRVIQKVGGGCSAPLDPLMA